MRPLAPSDLLSPEDFARVRGPLREAVIAHKARRRVAVGDRVTLVFEDRETLRWQVLEMCRVEGIRDPAAVQAELDVYNELVPGDHELSATLFVEITDRAGIRAELDRLIGIDEHVALHVGDEEVRATFDPKQLEEERISAVQYVRFPLGAERAARFADPATPLRLRIDHARYTAETPLDADTRRALAVDLTGEPAPLVDPGRLPDRPAEAGPEVVARRGRARALRPVRPRAPGHLVVEAGEGRGFPDAEPALVAEVLALAQEVSREILRRHGACRVSFDAAAARVRCDVYAPPPERGRGSEEGS